MPQWLADLLLSFLTKMGLGWLAGVFSTGEARNAGAQEQAAKDLSASKAKQDEIDTVAANPPTDDEVEQRLKDHSA